MSFHSFYTPAESSKQCKSQNSCIPFLKWMIIDKNVFFISLIWLNILYITGEK